MSNINKDTTLACNNIALKRLFYVVNGSTPKSDVDEYWDGDVPWVTPVDLNNDSNKYIRSTKRRITRSGLNIISGLVDLHLTKSNCFFPLIIPPM